MSLLLYMVLGVIGLACIAIVNVPLYTARRLIYWINAMKYTILSKDLPKKFAGTNYVKMEAPPPQSQGGKRVVRLIFVRHGQSCWNSVVNSFGIMWPYRVIRTILFETYYMLTDPWNSLLIDTPLSAKGVKEAGELCAFIRNVKATEIPHDAKDSLIVCSNLRRAMATAAIGLAPRTKVTGERIIIDSSLQEGSRNIDAQCFNTFKQKLISSPVHIWKTALAQSAVFDPKFNMGNKSNTSTVYLRMDDFVRHVFGGSQDGGYVPSAGGTNADVRTVVVVGHSGWFRSFFRRFLPESSTHISKIKKLETSACICVELIRDEATGLVYIEETSIRPIFKNFAKK